MGKKIEPTDRMIRAVETWSGIVGTDARAILRAALNHPDAPGLFADEDDRPWEPLDGGRVHVGDEVRQDLCNVTVIAVVGEVDEEGDPRTAEGRLIGLLSHGTWYRRRAVQELPTKPETVIERADGHKYITAMVNGETWRTREAALSWGGNWHAVWRSGNRTRFDVRPEHITPGTWKKDDQ